MANELVLSSQIGTALLQELIADGPHAQQMKEMLKGSSECNPDPNVSNPRTMRTAFAETMDKPAVIARLHEMRDTLPPNSMDTREYKRASLTGADVPLGDYYGLGMLTGDSFTASGNMTNSQDMRYVMLDASDGGDNLFTLKNFRQPNNTIDIGSNAGMFLIHGEITYTMSRAYDTATPPPPSVQTSPEFLAPDSVMCPYKLFLSVNAEETLSSSLPPLGDVEIIQRSPYFSQEVLSGNFTRNEVTKGTKKTRGFSIYLKLNAGDMISLQLQRGQTMATYGDIDSTYVVDGIFLHKTTAQGVDDPSNWIEIVRMA